MQFGVEGHVIRGRKVGIVCISAEWWSALATSRGRYGVSCIGAVNGGE